MTLQVDIVSDFVCPWCWLGWRQFEQAGLDAEARFRPYLLDPDVPREGLDHKTYLATKYGNASERFKGMREHLEAAAPDAGIVFRFDKIEVRPNTLDAHRLTRWAQGQDLGEACAGALFRAVFDELRDIGSRDVLCDIAARIGMDAGLVGELLDSDRDLAKVEDEATFFRRLGVSGVPTFIYEGRLAVQGAQPPEAHQEVVTELQNELQKTDRQRGHRP